MQQFGPERSARLPCPCGGCPESRVECRFGGGLSSVLPQHSQVQPVHRNDSDKTAHNLCSYNEYPVTLIVCSTEHMSSKLSYRHATSAQVENIIRIRLYIYARIIVTVDQSEYRTFTVSGRLEEVPTHVKNFEAMPEAGFCTCSCHVGYFAAAVKLEVAS